MTLHDGPAVPGADAEQVDAREWIPFGSGPGGSGFMAFGRCELLYAVLALLDENSVRTVAKLGFAEAEVNDVARLIGGSSLYAQGLLVSDDGETFVPVREALLLARAAAAPTMWITLGEIDALADDAMLGIVADDALLLVASSGLSGFAVTMVPAGDQLLDVIGSMLEGMLDRSSERGSPVAVNVSRPGESDDDSSTLFVRRHRETADAFEVAVGRGTTTTPPILPGAKRGDDVDLLLAEALRVDPDTGASLDASRDRRAH